MWVIGFFFFFKQKTAYEMRISDWSSDVCSSDLLPQVTFEAIAERRGKAFRHLRCRRQTGSRPVDAAVGCTDLGPARHIVGAGGRNRQRDQEYGKKSNAGRSEEHTSELQSLMRNSYAVFCLKKKKKQTDTTHINTSKSTLHREISQNNTTK